MISHLSVVLLLFFLNDTPDAYKWIAVLGTEVTQPLNLTTYSILILLYPGYLHVPVPLDTRSGF